MLTDKITTNWRLFRFWRSDMIPQVINHRLIQRNRAASPFPSRQMFYCSKGELWSSTSLSSCHVLTWYYRGNLWFGLKYYSVAAKRRLLRHRHCNLLGVMNGESKVCWRRLLLLFLLPVKRDPVDGQKRAVMWSVIRWEAEKVALTCFWFCLVTLGSSRVKVLIPRLCNLNNVNFDFK